MEVWAEIVAPKYTRYRHIVGGGLGAHSDSALERYRPRPGDTVLDIGCGMGESAMQLSAIVGREGRVVAVDCAEAFLDIARREADAAGVDNIEYLLLDAQTHRFEQQFDFVFSRFGTMFFQGPVPALRNVRRAMKPGARLSMVVWRRIEANDWLGASKEIATELLPPLTDDAQSCGPGPFSMASADVVTDILTAAGFREPTLHRQDHEVLVGRDIPEAIAFQLALGPTGELYREAGEEGERRRPEIDRRLTELFEPWRRDDGTVYGMSSAWNVTAVNPG